MCGNRPSKHDHACQGVVAPAVFLGQFLELQPVLQLGHRDQAVDQPAPVGALHGPGIIAGGRAELAGDRLQHVAHSDHALHRTVFVDHEDQLGARGAEVLEQLHARQRLGHEHRRLQVIGQRGAAALGQRLEQAVRRDNADHVVQPVPADGVA
jgi:hypothetical protein